MSDSHKVRKERNLKRTPASLQQKNIKGLVVPSAKNN